MVEISVVVPVYKSEDCLSELNRQIVAALQKKYTFELILVNDQSPDNSWQVISRLAEEFSNVVGINLRKNAGQDNAIMCGLARAQGEFVVIMDDDLQHSPFDIPTLCAECRRRDLDICYARFPIKKHAIWKNFGSWLNGKISELVIGKPAEIYLSPYKIIRLDVVKEVIKYTGPFPYVDGLIFSVTHNVGQTDVEHHMRFSGESNYNLVRSIKVFLKVATSFSVVPLRISSFIGMVSSVAGFILAGYYLYEYFANTYKVEGWTTLTVLFLVIGGAILFSIGIIGEYLGRAYLNLNGKPQYVIREIRNGRF